MARRNGTAAGIHRHERTRGQAAHDHGTDVHGAAIVLEPCRDLGKFLAGEVRHRVQHVGTGIEQEAAAGQLGLLAPRTERGRRPILPDDRVDVEDRSELTGAQHSRRLPDLRRQAALERHDEQSPRAVACVDQFDGLVRGHDHRFLEEDIEAGLQARRCLREVEHVGRDDENGIEPVRERGQEPGPVGLIGRDRKPALVEQLGECRVGSR